MKKLPKGSYVWADWKKLHKQGKVVDDYYPVYTPTTYQGMLQVKPVSQAQLDRPLLPEYKEFWIDPNDLVDAPAEPVTTPQPPTATISDEQAAQAIVTVLKYIKQ